MTIFNVVISSSLSSLFVIWPINVIAVWTMSEITCEEVSTRQHKRWRFEAYQLIARRFAASSSRTNLLQLPSPFTKGQHLRIQLLQIFGFKAQLHYRDRSFGSGERISCLQS